MVGKYNRRQFLIYASTTLSASLFLKACSDGSKNSTAVSLNSTATPAPQDYKIAIVLPGIITDKAWNQAGYEGLEVVRQKLGMNAAYAEQVEQADQTEALADFARRGYNLVYAHGGQFDAAIQQIAPQFPDTFFIGVNGAVSGENMASLRIDHLQASYICGIIAANMSKSNKIAYLAAQSFQATDEERRGFELGAKSVKPNIEIAATYTQDWNDAAKAKEATLALISAGVDTIYQWLDNASIAVLQTCAEKGIYAFGNTTDQLEIAPQAVLTSAVKRVDLAIAFLAELALQGNLQGQIYSLGFEQSDILYLGKFGKMVPEKIRETAMATKDEILAQKLKFEPCEEGGKATRCVKGLREGRDRG